MDDVIYWGSVILIYVVIEIVLRFLIDGKLGSYSLHLFQVGTVFQGLQAIFICGLAAIVIRFILDLTEIFG